MKIAGCTVLWFGLLICLLTQPVEAQSRPKIAMLDLGDKGVGEQAASLLTTVVAKQLASYGVFDVLSKEDIRKLLSHEQDKVLLGCTKANCMAQIGSAVGAQSLIAGDIGLVGKKYLITLQRMNIKTVKVEKRVERTFRGAPGDMIDQARLAAHKVVEDLLQAESGTLFFNCSEEASDISVDGNVVGTSPMKALSLPAGPHDIRVVKKGFVTWARTVKVKPKATDMVEITLIPSASFVAEYEDRAISMRRWAWISAVACLTLEGTALALRMVTLSKYDPIVDDYNNANYGKFENAQAYYDHYHDEIELADRLDYTALALGIVGALAGGVSLYLFLEGEEPDRYQRFRNLQLAGPIRFGPGQSMLVWTF